MLETYKHLTAHQFAAALATLNACIEQCPEETWNTPVGTHPFCRVAFHTLFFTDFYLCRDEEQFRKQAFHRKSAEFFADYEELEHREPVRLYERDEIKRYLTFVLQKAEKTIADETEETLQGPSGFERRKIRRAELHVYNMRHVQHHAAQLSLRLRIDHGIAIPWFAGGWPSTA